MTSWYRKVIWSEGMFLQPHHFQQQDRYVEQLVRGRAAAISGYFWGYNSLSVDESALALGKVVLTRARGVMPDGTPFDFPADGATLAPLDIPADARDERVFLVLPVRRPGAQESDWTLADPLTRYSLSETEVPDSNAGADRAALLQLGTLKLALVMERDATDAYVRLGTVHVVERRPDNQVILDKTYIPPCLDVGDNPVLSGALREILGLLNQRGDVLAARLGQPGRGGVAEMAEFLLLQTINRFEPLFAHLDGCSTLHPERLFALCLQLAGDLATFTRENHRPPSLPDYEHDALERCFPPVVDELRRSLSVVLEQNAIPIDLKEHRSGVRVAIIPDLELIRTAGFVLAVNAQMPADTLRARFPAQAKLGPVERIRDLVNLALPGIALRVLPIAPRQIPYHANFHYFELDKGSDLWKQLAQSGGLALHVAGDFPGLELEMWAIRG
jgi:type VI secretion system protein ImpJ